MANWYGMGRTNYFRVKDAGKFKNFVDQFDGAVLIEKDGCYGFYNNTELGEQPSRWTALDQYGDFTDESDEIFILDEIHKHLAEDDVVIYQESGSVRARYVTGMSLAINSKGESIRIDIDDIFKVAEDKFGIQATHSSY